MLLNRSPQHATPFMVKLQSCGPIDSTCEVMEVALGLLGPGSCCATADRTGYARF